MPLINPNASIRSTLLAWLLPLMALFMLVAWLIHGSLLDRMTRSFVHERLHQEAMFLKNQVKRFYPRVDSALAASPYFDDVFHHAFAIKVGDAVSVSPEALDSILRPALTTSDKVFFSLGNTTSRDADSGNYIAYKTVFDIGGDKAIIVVAEDLSILESNQAELHAWTAFVAAGLLVILIVLVLLAVYLALKPVRQLRRSLQELQGGKQTRLSLGAPREFVPLIQQINHLLDKLDQRLQRSRESLANLSHSIKTPIAVIQQALEDTDRDIDQAYRLKLATRLAEIDQQLESEMRRSQFAGPQVGQQAKPIQQARDLVWMIGRLYRNINFELNTNLSTEFSWPVEEHDLNEMLGNLLDNAGKWAATNVGVVIAQSSQALVIIVKDDGSGVNPEELHSLGTRGLRLDQQTPGHGLGLAILRDLVTRYDGTLEFRNSAHGGFEAEVVLRSPGG
ncbi:sensor histidine kinase [Marinobacter sp. 1Y8]